MKCAWKYFYCGRQYVIKISKRFMQNWNCFYFFASWIEQSSINTFSHLLFCCINSPKSWHKKILRNLWNHLLRTPNTTQYYLKYICNKLSLTMPITILQRKKNSWNNEEFFKETIGKFNFIPVKECCITKKVELTACFIETCRLMKMKLLIMQSHRKHWWHFATKKNIGTTKYR